MSNLPETMPRAVVYKTASNYEKKGIQELEQHGVSAFTHYDVSGDRAKVTAPGYIFANRAVKAAFLKHVRSKPVGFARLSDIANLHVGKTPKAPQREVNPFSIGQSVLVGEIPGVVASTDGVQCVVAVTMLGKQHLRPLHYSRLRPG